MIHKVRINKKYPFKQMSPGETFKLNELDVRGAQKLAYYYRSLCKRPIQVVVTKQDGGYYCRALLRRPRINPGTVAGAWFASFKKQRRAQDRSPRPAREAVFLHSLKSARTDA